MLIYTNSYAHVHSREQEERTLKTDKLHRIGCFSMQSSALIYLSVFMRYRTVQLFKCKTHHLIHINELDLK